MISICKLLLIKESSCIMQLYVSLKINLDIPFPNTIKTCKIFQPIFPVAFSYKKDSVVVSQNKNQSKNKQKTLKVYAIKCNDRKTEVRRVQTESVLIQWGCSHPQANGFHHPWITHGVSPPIPVKKLQKHNFSHLFSVG